MSSLQERVKAAREVLRQQIPEQYRIPEDKLPPESQTDVRDWPLTSGLYTADELAITESTVPELLVAQRTRKWTAVQIAEAFAKRAAHAHQLLNCLAVAFFDEGIARAKELDAYFEEHDTFVGPLHGIPVSLKDQFLMAGKTNVFGFVSQADKRFDGPEMGLVPLLRDMGAVLYCKTALPPGMMDDDTVSVVYGATLNPANRTHSPGGSSGGEGALSGFRGTPVGVGSDIGGSIRTPAHMCGIYGLKASLRRFPLAGSVDSIEGQHTVLSTLGPLAPSLESAVYFTRVVWNWTCSSSGLVPADLGLPDKTPLWAENTYDPNIIPMGYRPVPIPQKLCFGVFVSDGKVTPTPPVQRAMDAAVAALKKAGHEIIEWKPHRHAELADIANASYNADGGRYIRELLGEEQMLPFYVNLFQNASDIGVGKLWDMHSTRLEIEQEYFRQWESTAARTSTGRPIDAILCPVAPHSSRPSLRPYYSDYLTAYNALEMPSAVVPVLQSDKTLDGKPAHEPISPADAAVWDDYDPEIFDHGFVGVQIVTKRYNDELALAAAAFLDKALQEYQ